MAGDCEELGGGLSDGLVEQAGLFVCFGALVEGLHGAWCDVEREELCAGLGEQVRGLGELLKVGALEELDELGECDVVCAADGRGAEIGIEDVIEKRVGCVRVGVHAVMFARGVIVAR